MILWMPFFFLLDDSLESSAFCPLVLAAVVAGVAVPSLAAAAGVAVPGAPVVPVVDVEFGLEDDDDSPGSPFATGGFTGALGAGGFVVGDAAAPEAGLLNGGFDGGVFAAGALVVGCAEVGAIAAVPG
jgi:hypothetical protein